jgi:hypothetical protein
MGQYDHDRPWSQSKSEARILNWGLSFQEILTSLLQL